MTSTTPPFVSVIIPVYNNTDGIHKAITALMAQTYPADRFEVVVADNNSNDGTGAIVDTLAERYPGRVRRVVESRVQTSYAARNKGIEEARGEVFAFTDSDCIPDARWIEAGVAGLVREDAACGGGGVEFTFHRERPNVYEYFDSARKLNQRSYVVDSGFAATANFFARARLFTDYGPFLGDLVSGGDYEFGRRVTARGEKLIYIEDAVVGHPARRTYREIVKKSRRVAQGQRQLAQRGLLKRPRAGWRQILPARSWPKDGKWDRTLTLIEKAQLLWVQTAIRWSTARVKAEG
ncbi:MAG: glycosyltransferase [SAR202 cluster bacterium]|nr:glycosyltransferase [SAR202 cluster bacterium]